MPRCRTLPHATARQPSPHPPPFTRLLQCDIATCQTELDAALKGEPIGGSINGSIHFMVGGPMPNATGVTSGRPERVELHGDAASFVSDHKTGASRANTMHRGAVEKPVHFINDETPLTTPYYKHLITSLILDCTRVAQGTLQLGRPTRRVNDLHSSPFSVAGC